MGYGKRGKEKLNEVDRIESEIISKIASVNGCVIPKYNIFIFNTNSVVILIYKHRYLYYFQMKYYYMANIIIPT